MALPHLPSPPPTLAYAQRLSPTSTKGPASRCRHAHMFAPAVTKPCHQALKPQQADTKVMQDSVCDFVPAERHNVNKITMQRFHVRARFVIEDEGCSQISPRGHEAQSALHSRRFCGRTHCSDIAHNERQKRERPGHRQFHLGSVHQDSTISCSVFVAAFELELTSSLNAAVRLASTVDSRQTCCTFS